MNKHSNSAVIISADARLKRILLNNASKADKFEISLEENILNLSSKSKLDAYIYDVELSNNDLDSTIAAITDLKKIISKKPLILIGRESILTKVLGNKEVENLVAKTINKPISFGQLQLAISTSLKKPMLLKRPVPQKKPSSQRRVVAALTIALISVSAFAYLQTEQSTSDPIDYSLSVPQLNQDSALADTINLEPDNQIIQQHNQSALLAIKEGRLSEPANDNAIYYLNQIKKNDPYSSTANQIHKNIFALLEASYLEHSSRGNDQATKKALNKITEFEPYNHKYTQLLRELKERIYLSTLSDAN